MSVHTIMVATGPDTFRMPWLAEFYNREVLRPGDTWVGPRLGVRVQGDATDVEVAIGAMAEAVEALVRTERGPEARIDRSILKGLSDVALCACVADASLSSRMLLWGVAHTWAGLRRTGSVPNLSRDQFVEESNGWHLQLHLEFMSRVGMVTVDGSPSFFDPGAQQAPLVMRLTLPPHIRPDQPDFMERSLEWGVAIMAAHRAAVAQAVVQAGGSEA